MASSAFPSPSYPRLALSFLVFHSPSPILASVSFRMLEPFWSATGTVWHTPNQVARDNSVDTASYICQEAYSPLYLMHALVNERVYLVMSFRYVRERSENYFMHVKPNIGNPWFCCLISWVLFFLIVFLYMQLCIKSLLGWSSWEQMLKNGLQFSA